MFSLNAKMSEGSDIVYKSTEDLYIEGIGNEVLVALVVIAFITPVITYILYRIISVHQVDDDEQEMARLGTIEGAEQVEGNRERRRYYNAGNCPICLTEPIVFPCETSCGHLYCGLCLRSLFYLASDASAVLCPLCRQRVNLLYICFNNNASLDTHEDTLSFNSVVEFVQYYNRKFSGQPRSLMDHINDLPIILRHLWNDFFTIGGLIRIRLRLRICLCFISALFYLCVPQDLFPETVFGFIGLVDDFLVIIFVIFYLAMLYRNAVVNEDFNEARDMGSLN